MQIQAGEVVRVKGDPDHPANFGRLCGKGSALADTLLAHTGLSPAQCVYVGDSPFEGPATEARGVNDRVELAAAEAVLRRRLLERLMRAGVTVVDPATTFVDVDVEVGADTVLEPLTFLEAGTRVGARCRLGPNARLVGCTVDDEATVT